MLIFHLVILLEGFGSYLISVESWCFLGLGTLGLFNLIYRICQYKAINKIKKYIPSFDKYEFLSQGILICEDSKKDGNSKLDRNKKMSKNLYKWYNSQDFVRYVKFEESYLKSASVKNNIVIVKVIYKVEFVDAGAIKIKMIFKGLCGNKQIEYCPNCCAKIDNNSDFCKYCGSRIVSENTKWELIKIKQVANVEDWILDIFFYKYE